MRYFALAGSLLIQISLGDRLAIDVGDHFLRIGWSFRQTWFDLDGSLRRSGLILAGRFSLREYR